ncbi:MAG: DUF2764 family protein [Cyanobacteria bacterium SID2]|nr:DUF2764 family protein [Cyanobacteria bacterium SID2]MBP0005765.1 DUF2764 family protein [Cyanobacteria bacterium SBC]
MARYITLMASLPALGQLFGSKQTPISRLKLESRLKMLEEEDAALLGQIESLVHWSHLPMERTDAQIVAAAKHFFQEVRNPILREVVESRLELHTVVAALRRRQRGESAPPSGEPWGYGRWVGQIQRYWTEPGFRLESAFPWLVEANRLSIAHESVALEQLLFSVVWNKLGRLGMGHYFDFEAVVVYVLRWNLVDRWTRYEGEAAVDRFRTMVDSGIQEFTNVFA